MSSKIYKITNLINNKIYIGYTKQSLEKRFKQHCNYRKGIHHTLLQNAIHKYGVENFKIELVEESEDDNYIHKIREAHWIKKLNCLNHDIGYNIAKGGDGGDTLSHNPNKKEIYTKIAQKIRGNCIYHNPETNEYIRILKGQEIPTGFIKGLPRDWYKNAVIHSRKHHSPINKGSKWSEEDKLNIKNKTREAMSKIKKIKCPYCGKECAEFVYHRYHGSNCKYNPNKKAIPFKVYIMKITNTVTSRIFVNYHKDWSDDIDNQFGTDPFLKHAIKKYGRNNFKKDILEYCTDENKQERKQYWIKKLHSDNNLIGFNRHTS